LEVPSGYEILADVQRPCEHGRCPDLLGLMTCAYRKPKSGHNGDEARLGSRVN
jgi:hypothetical protein